MVTTIYRGSGLATYITLRISDRTELRQRLLGENYIRLNESYTTVQDITLGDFYLFNGTTYYVNSLPSIKRKGKQYEHDVIFESVQYELTRTQFRSNLNESEFYFTGDLDDFLTLIVSNVNRTFTGWAKGTVDNTNKTEYKNLHFSGENCMNVLQRLCEEYDGEYSITGRTIAFTDDVGTASGLTFGYGSTKGLREVERLSVADHPVITRLYAYGGSKNLGADYRNWSPRLQFVYGGNTSYVEKNTSTYGVYEFTQIFDWIYPHFTGSVGTVGGTYKFADKLIDFNVNSYLLPGIAPKIHFQDGDLAGYQFEVSKYNSTLHSLTLLPYVDEWTKSLPNNTLNIATGDHYTILDITMPTAYISEAETLLLQQATSFINDYSAPVVQYRVKPDWKYMAGLSTTLGIGDQITIVDTAMAINATTRIVGLSRKIWRSSDYTLEVADHLAPSLGQRIYADTRNIMTKGEVSKLGDIPQERWGWWVTRGENTGRTWATDSGLPGHYKRIKIDGTDGKLSFYNSSNVEVLKIDDSIYGSFPGIYINTGAIYLYKDADNNFWGDSGGMGITSDEKTYTIAASNRKDDTVSAAVSGDGGTTGAGGGAGEKRMGVRGISSIANESNAADAIGVYGYARSTGSGKPYGGYFDGGDFYTKLGDNAGANKHIIHDSDGVTVHAIDSDGVIFGPAGDYKVKLASAKNFYIYDASGSAIFRVSSAGTIYAVNDLITKKAGSGSTAPSLVLEGYKADASAGGYLKLKKSHNNTSGAMTATQNNEYLGVIDAYGVNASTDFALGARILFKQFGSAATNYVPSAIYFATSDGTTSPQLKTAITSEHKFYHGDLAVNYFKLSSCGAVSLFGVARVYNAEWIDAGGIKAPGSKPATAVAHGTLETPAWQFANQALAANEESVSCDIRAPNRMDRTVAPTLTIGWSTPATSGAIKWLMEYVWRSEGEATNVAGAESLYATTNVPATAYGMKLSTFSGIDTPAAADVCIHCRIKRKSSSDDDSVANTVDLHGLCFQWVSNKIGTPVT